MSTLSSASSPTRITEDSFKEIYQLYWRKVYTVCYHSIGDPELVKEMVQDIFKSLWERKNELEITQSVEKYLVRSAKLKVFEHFRNEKSHKQHLQHLGSRQVQAQNYTEHEVLAQSLSERLASLIERLPSQCQRVFRMSREQGLTNKEIASHLLISERAVEHHISKALFSLKTNLPEYAV